MSCNLLMRNRLTYVTVGPAPVLMTDALPGVDAVTVETPWVGLALMTFRAFPPEVTPALVGLVAVPAALLARLAALGCRCEKEADV